MGLAAYIISCFLVGLECRDPHRTWSSDRLASASTAATAQRGSPPDLLLAPGQRKWLESITKQPVGGQVIEQFFGALDGKVDLRSPWKHPAPHERGAG